MELEQPVWRTRVVNGDSPELRKAAAALALALLLLNILDVMVTNFSIRNLGGGRNEPCDGADDRHAMGGRVQVGYSDRDHRHGYMG